MSRGTKMRVSQCQGARGLLVWAGRGISARVRGGKRGFIGAVEVAVLVIVVGVSTAE